MIGYTQKLNEQLATPVSSEMHTIGIIGVSTYASGLIRLVQVPEKTLISTVVIPGYNEIPSGTPTGTQFVVDYTTGVITFANSQNGNIVSVSYNGLGSEIAAEDINEVQSPLNSIASLTLSYMSPFTSATATWALAPNIVKPSNISNTVTDDFTFPRDVFVTRNLVPLFLTSTSVNSASSGIIRLSNTDTIDWRNAGNSANLALSVDSSNNLLWNGDIIATSSSSPVLSITGTSHQIIASSSTGNITLSTPQNIDTTSVVQFGSLSLGSSANSSAILTLVSTTQGFLPPSMTTTQRNAISSPAAGLVVYDSTLNQLYLWNNSSWVILG